MARRERGAALVLVVLTMSALAAIGLGLVMSASLERLAMANVEDAVHLVNAADAALELTVAELDAAADWNEVLSGARRSSRVDGPPGPRVVPGGAELDLAVRTHELTCGRPSACTDAQVAAFASERPWGANNPRWRLFLHEMLAAGAGLPRRAPPVYVIAWIGDDGGEVDGDPTRDGAGPGEEGRYIVRARAEVYGPGGSRRTVEAELARVCQPAGGALQCLPGVRVSAWRAVGALAP